MQKLKRLLPYFICFTFCLGSLYANAQLKNYLALGDSYTIGESVDSKLRWPNQLIDSLNKTQIQFNEAQIIATTGWRTDDLKSAISKKNFKAAQFDMVSLLIGVNNQYQGKNIESFKLEFKELLETAISLSKNGKGGVFVLSIPNYGATPFGQRKNPEKIEREINEYNRISKEICKDLDILYLNITDISNEALSKPELVAEDGLHPSGLMYNKWVNSILPKIKRDILK